VLWLLLQVMDSAEAVLTNCTVSEAAEEGIAVMDSGRVALQGTVVRRCGGPGIDVSGSGRVAVSSGCDVEGCGGRLWVWEEAGVEWQGAAVQCPAPVQ
jgi:hypothetical protein